MYRNFHAGEAQMQAAAGIDTASYDEAVDQSFQPELNPSEVRFVGKRTFSIAASLDADGRPWASPLLGAEGDLFHVENLTTVQVRTQPIAGDPLRDNLRTNSEMGILYFDPSRRRRAKSLGHGSIQSDGSINYQMHRVFGLCTKYIFKRTHVAPATHKTADTSHKPTTSTTLAARDITDLTTADTIFLATTSERFGPDPTHRGGPAGFVSVIDESTIVMPDYAGNGMFQTFGNLLLNNRIGLLSIDFATGRSIQTTGRGSLEPADATEPYSMRTLMISIDEVRTSWPAIGGWTDLEPFDISRTIAP